MHKLPTWVEIDLDALSENVGVIRRHVSGVAIMVLVKADAYGHGAVQIARSIESKVDVFGVATVDEAVELARAGIAKRLFVISPILAEEIPAVVDGGFIATVTTVGFAERMSAYATQRNKTAEIHLEIDTGMGRAGVSVTEAKALLRRVAQLPGLQLGGMFTHFPAAETDSDFTRKQIDRFLELAVEIEKEGIDIPVLHSANSAGLALHRSSHMAMVRPGLIVYGQKPAGVEIDLALRPLLHWKCRVAQIRELPAGATVSYLRTHTTERPTTMAVLPVGYGHGYPLRLSNRGDVLVGGMRAPIRGRVTMDMTMVDVTDVKPAPIPGDEVVLVGAQGSESITVDEIADWVGTISYEILTGISKRVPRIYFRNGKVETYKSLLGVSSSQRDYQV